MPDGVRHCPRSKRYVFSRPLNALRDKLLSRRVDGKLFQTVRLSICQTLRVMACISARSWYSSCLIPNPLLPLHLQTDALIAADVTVARSGTGEWMYQRAAAAVRRSNTILRVSKAYKQESSAVTVENVAISCCASE